MIAQAAFPRTPEASNKQSGGACLAGKNVPSDMVAEPPQPCGFAVGDEVIYTNDNGVEFIRKVRGFSNVADGGRFVYLNTQSWWYPVDPSSLRVKLLEAQTGAA